MQQYETVEFKLGNTTLKSLFNITIPYNYGDPVPECHSHAPIGVPFKQPLYNIINMINRGLKVQPSLEDSEKIYYFLIAYNKQAAELNKQLGEIVNPMAQEAEDYFSKKMSFKVAKENREDPMVQHNPFTKTIAPPYTPKSNVLNSKAIQATFKKYNKSKTKIDTRRPEEHKMYEMFNVPDSALLAPNGIDQEAFNVNKINKDMPDYMDDMIFSGVNDES